MLLLVGGIVLLLGGTSRILLEREGDDEVGGRAIAGAADERNGLAIPACARSETISSALP